MEQNKLIAIIVVVALVAVAAVGAVFLLKGDSGGDTTYTVKYETNGGNAIDDTEFTKNTDTFDLTIPTRDGYTFLGWYLSSDFNGDAVTQVAKGTEKNLTVYAKWQLNLTDASSLTSDNMRSNTNVSVVLSSDASDEQKVIDSSVIKEITSGKAVTVTNTDTSGKETLSWTFNGADSVADGYNNDSVSTKVTPDTSKLEDEKKITLNFEYEGTLPYPSTIRYYVGTDNFPAGTKISVIHENGDNLGEYAVDSDGYIEFTISHCSDWILREYVEITFDADGGAFSDGAVTATVGGAYKSAVAAPSDPVRKGYAFQGWDSVPATFLAAATVKALWSENTYTLAFDKNRDGAVGSMDSVTISFTETKIIPASGFTVAGYEISSWAFSNGTSFAPGAEITGETVCDNSADGVATLYGAWSAKTYTLTFDATGGESTASTMSVTYDQKVGDMPVADRAGYTFKGWNTVADGSGTTYTSDTVYATDSGTLLYAVWEIVNYSITYVLDGGTNSASNVSTYTVVDSVTLAAATKDGYGFGGWYLTSDFSGTGLTEIVKRTGDITLYAKWGPYNIVAYFKVDGKALGITDTVSAVLDSKSCQMTKVEDGKYLLESSSDFPIENGKTYAVKRGDTQVASITVADGYGETIVNYYTVTLMNDTEVYDKQTVISGDKAVAPQTNPERTGYTFDKWKLSNGSEYDFDTAITGEAVIWAAYTANKYTVSFDTDGGSAVADIEIAYASDPDNAAVPTKEGYGFQGYYAGDKQYFDADGKPMFPSWNITENTTLKAKWGAMSVKIRFGDLPTLNAIYGEAMPALNANYKADQEYGKRFVGYYDSETGGTKYYNADLSSAVQVSDLTADTTMYAHYEVITYAVVFDTNGGTGDMPTDKTVELGGTITKPLADPSRTGYDFTGWSPYATVSMDVFEGGDYAVSSTLLEPEGSTFTLYAQWTERTYTVVYDANGGSGTVPSSVTVKTGKELELPEFGTRKTVDGTTMFFGGWNSAADGSGKTYRGTVTMDSEMAALASGTTVTLYVKWVAMDFTPSVGYTFSGKITYDDGASYDVRMTVIAVGETTYRVEERRIYEYSSSADVYEFNIGTYPVMNGYSSEMIDAIKGGSQSTEKFTINGVERNVTVYTKEYTYSGNTSVFVLRITDDGFICSTSVTTNGNTGTTSYTAHATGSVAGAKVTYRMNGGTPSEYQERSGKTFLSATELGVTKSGYTFAGWRSTDMASGSGMYLAGDAVTYAMTVDAVWEKVKNPQTNIYWEIINLPSGVTLTIDGQDALPQSASEGKVMVIGGGSDWTYDNGSKKYSFLVDGKTWYLSAPSYAASNSGVTESVVDGNLQVVFGTPNTGDWVSPYNVYLHFEEEMPEFGMYSPGVGDAFVYSDGKTQETLTVTEVLAQYYRYTSSIDQSTTLSASLGNYPDGIYSRFYPSTVSGWLAWRTGTVEFGGSVLDCYVVYEMYTTQYYLNSSNQGMYSYNEIELYIGMGDGLCYKAVFSQYDSYIGVSSTVYTLVSKPADMQVVRAYETTMVFSGGTFDGKNTAVENLTGPSASVIPTRDGYTFKGWAVTGGGDLKYTYTKSAFTPVYFDPSDITDGKITLYAVWEEIPVNTYEVVFKYNSNTLYTAKIAENQTTYTIPDVSTLGLASGPMYRCYASSFGVFFTYKPGDTANVEDLLKCMDGYERVNIMVVSPDAVLYVVSAIDSSNCHTFEVNTGNPTYVLPAKEEIGISEENRTALRFNTSADGSGTDYGFHATMTMDQISAIYDDTKGTFTLYVLWSDAKTTVTVTVHANNGGDDTAEIEIDPTKDYEVELTDDMSGWTYSGHTAMGLSFTAAGGEYYQFDDTIPVDVLEENTSNGAIALYVAWVSDDDIVEARIYANYDDADPQYVSMTIDLNRDIELPPEASNLGWSRDDYVAIRFDTAADGSENSYEFGDTIGSDVLKEMTKPVLYVIWESSLTEVKAWVLDTFDEDNPVNGSFGVDLSGDTWTVDVGVDWAHDGYVMAGIVIVDGEENPHQYAIGDEAETSDLRTYIVDGYLVMTVVWEESA